jgi:hypothetical protein
MPLTFIFRFGAELNGGQEKAEMYLIQLKDHRIDEQTEQKRQKQYSREREPMKLRG